MAKLPLKGKDTMTGRTLTRIRRRRFLRALELAVAGFVMSLLAVSLERSLAGRGGNAFRPRCADGPTR